MAALDRPRVPANETAWARLREVSNDALRIFRENTDVEELVPVEEITELLQAAFPGNPEPEEQRRRRVAGGRIDAALEVVRPIFKWFLVRDLRALEEVHMPEQVRAVYEIVRDDTIIEMARDDILQNVHQQPGLMADIRRILSDNRRSGLLSELLFPLAALYYRNGGTLDEEDEDNLNVLYIRFMRHLRNIRTQLHFGTLVADEEDMSTTIAIDSLMWPTVVDRVMNMNEDDHPANTNNKTEALAAAVWLYGVDSINYQKWLDWMYSLTDRDVQNAYTVHTYVIACGLIPSNRQVEESIRVFEGGALRRNFLDFFYDSLVFKGSHFATIDQMRLNQVRHINRPYGPRKTTFLHECVRSENEPAVRHLLRELGANPNVRDADGDTPLHIILRKPEAEILPLGSDQQTIARMLINFGASRTLTNHAGRTAFEECPDPHVAARYEIQDERAFADINQHVGAGPGSVIAAFMGGDPKRAYNSRLS